MVGNALRLNFFDMHDGRRDKKVRHKPRKDQPQDAAPRNTACCTARCPVPPAAAEGTVERTMEIEGMMCEHCERTVQKALEAVPAYSRPPPTPRRARRVIRMLPDTPDDALSQAVEEAGYLPTACGNDRTPVDTEGPAHRRFPKTNNQEDCILMKKMMKVEGMHCAGCSGRLKRLLEALPGWRAPRLTTRRAPPRSPSRATCRTTR